MKPMPNLPDDLRHALDSALTGVPVHKLAPSVQRLIDSYRRPAGPVVRSDSDVVAYAAYRMPATYAAARQALGYLAEAAPALRPATQLDLGAGTGAAVWAAAATWSSLVTVTAVDREPEMVALGRRLAAEAASPAVRSANWDTARIGTHALPEADLITVSYALGELSAGQRISLARRLAEHRGIIIFIEPGTPAGYENVIGIRDQLISSGHTVIAPCPHSEQCPVLRDRDWCHFSARVNRSSLHRRVKNAVLGYEDEKFSYVALTMAAVGAPVPGRVLRHPQQGKGLVKLRICTTNGIESAIVSKRQSELYRAARDLEWGDRWPPPEGRMRRREASEPADPSHDDLPIDAGSVN
jgi:ribosomal protein RSM22 (predicted rRNA methylase)